MNDINELFFELIRVSIGTQSSLSRSPSAQEWKMLYDMAKKQSLVGICFAGVQKLSHDNDTLRYDNSIPLFTSALDRRQLLTINLPEVLYLTWMGMAAKIQQRNDVVSRQCLKLKSILSEKGFEASILKGQALMPYYGALAGLRQSGDIDVWLSVDIKTLVDLVKSMGYQYEAKHAHVSFMIPKNDIEIELHPKPSELRCPWHNRRLQRWFEQFKGQKNLGVEFNLVYLMEHMYHHALYEGIGLRQFLDYFFVLKHSHNSQRIETMKILEQLGMKRFAQSVMYIMQRVLGMDGEYMIGKPNPKFGDFLLNEIMAGGNFGHYDERYKNIRSGGLVESAICRLKKKSSFIKMAPWEILCSPIWSLWQIIWRKKNGYL